MGEEAAKAVTYAQSLCMLEQATIAYRTKVCTCKPAMSESNTFKGHSATSF